MRHVFVDTSGFYAMLDPTDPYHEGARDAFQQASSQHWTLHTTSYVVHETWALIQHRLGWQAVEAFLDRLLPLCRVEYVNQSLHALGAARCRQAHQRHLSLTDCISFEYAAQSGIKSVIANDEHFEREGMTTL